MMKKNNNRRIIPFLILLSVVLMLMSLAFSLYNRQVMMKTTEIKIKSEFIKKATADLHFRGVKSSDLTVRGYALVQNDHYQQMPLVRKITQQNFDTLEVLLPTYGYDLAPYRAVKDTILAYFDYQEYMMKLAEQGKMQEFKRLFEEDKGDKVWAFYNEFATLVNQTEDQRISRAQEDYQQALNGNILVQVLLVVIGVPTLLLILLRLRNERKARESLLAELQENNQNYLFNQGQNINQSDIEEQQIITDTVTNLQKAADFVRQIAEQNNYATWQGWQEEVHQPLNQQTLAGALHLLQDKLIQYNQESEARLWVNQGLEQLARLIRTYQEDATQMLQKCLSMMAGHLQAQYGAIYLYIPEDEQLNPVLRLSAAYALQKEHIKHKEFAIQEGLIGQVFQENKMKYLENVSEGYFKIGSGMGKTYPKSLLIAPIRWNESTEAIIELASLYTFTPTHLEFVQKAGEYLGSAIVFARNTA